MTKINTGIHADHRQRMKEKLRKFGIDIFNDHEVLEMLLMQTIPYKNTNPLAHKLINEFGSLANVLDASFDNLMMVTGVGKETAHHLSTFTQFMDRYNASKHKEDLVLNNTSKIVKYFKSRFNIGDKEVLYIICLNSMSKLIQVLTFDGFNETKIVINIKKVMQKIINSGASQIFLIHTHPYGDVKASEADEMFTSDIILKCYAYGIKVCDHLIFNETTHSSMRDFIFKVCQEKNINEMLPAHINKNFKIKS